MQTWTPQQPTSGHCLSLCQMAALTSLLPLSLVYGSEIWSYEESLLGKLWKKHPSKAQTWLPATAAGQGQQEGRE